MNKLLDSKTPLTLCVLAYAIDDELGSEAGSSYLWGKAWNDISGINNRFLLTRDKHAQKLINSKAMRNFTIVGFPDSGAEFGLPYSLRYIIWQIRCLIFIRRRFKLEQRLIIHSLSFHSMYLSLYTLLKSKTSDFLIVGPVGGLLPVNWRNFRYFNISGALKYLTKRCIGTIILQFNKMARNKTDVILCQNALVQRILSGKNTEVRPSASSDLAINPCNKLICVSDELPFSHFILGIGALTQLKAWKVAIQAIKDKEDYKLVIIGEGPDRERLERFLRKNELNNRVKLIGNVDREHVGCFIQKSSALIHPSFTEGSSIAIVEAICLNRDVITSSREGTGFVAYNCGTSVIEFNKRYPLHLQYKEVLEQDRKFPSPEYINPNQISKTIRKLIKMAEDKFLKN